MLPFHKRSRVNSSIEIGTDELEAIELPAVRPPSVRPASVRPSPYIAARPPMYSVNDDEEMTVIRTDKRISSSPPPSRRAVAMPRIPQNPAPRFDEDEPTMMQPGARPLLSMSSSTSSRNVIVAPEVRSYEVPPPPPPSSRARLDDAPLSSAAVDANASGVLRDLSMTSSVTGSSDLRRMRGRAAWGAGLVAVGVLAGLVVAFVARGEGIAAAAALVDPSVHTLTADVTKAVVAAPQARAAGAGAAQVQQSADKSTGGSCNADAVAAAVVAKVEAHGAQQHIEAASKSIEVKPVESKTVAYVAPRPVVHHVEQQVRESAQVAQVVAAPPPPVVAKPVAKAARQNDMESASAADALAKAQLEAALSR